MRIGAASRNEPHKLTVKSRKIVQIGSTFYVSIPRAFALRNNLTKGSQVAVVANDRLQVVVP